MELVDVDGLSPSGGFPVQVRVLSPVSNEVTYSLRDFLFYVKEW